jgi:hypothetical protein
MTRDLEEFLPTASSWFSPTLEYMGRCKAEFSAPQGSVEGPATVRVDEAGDVSVQMFPERESLRTERPFQLGLMRFFGGENFVQELGGGVSRLDPFAQNSCTRLEVTTPHGTFRTEDIPYYGTYSVMDTGEVTEANFAVGLSAFDADDGGDPEHWVLPLTNFLSECRQAHPELNSHPLRVFPTPEVPDEVTTVLLDQDEEKRRQDEERAVLSLYFANSKNKLIVFEFGGGLGFVERLPDYAESEELLVEGKEKSKTTAVMVGPAGGGSVERFEQMRDWFPFDVLSLLTLATGTEVGCPWVEIRDGQGRLVRRFHGGLGVRPFQKGRRLIEELPMPDRSGVKATGHLIECACSRSKELGQTFLRAAIVHLVRARHEDQTLDDSMSHIARGFETLCKRYHTNEQVLSRSLAVALRKDVKDVLDDAARQIKDLKKAAGVTDPGELAALDRIASRARSADEKDKGFGVAVVDLIKKFWLADAQILEDHYRGRTMGWGAILAHYRGDVTHHGYLDILEAGHDWEEIAAVRNHLHDVLARVILKILEFDGGYSPGVITQRVVPLTVDWVKPHFTAQALGYEK